MKQRVPSLHIRLLITAIGPLAALMLVGCGSGTSEAPTTASDGCAGLTGSEYAVCMGASQARQQAEASGELSDAEAPEDTEEAVEEEVGGPLAYVGTMTESDGKGTTFRNEVSLGPLLYSEEGTPPEAVLDACNLNYSSVIASSVYARGELTATYLEGRLPLTFPLSYYEYVAGEVLTRPAIEVDGEWMCMDENEMYLEFQSGESQTHPFWLIMPVLTNAHPRLSESLLDTMYIHFLGPPLYGWETWQKFQGPGRAECSEDEQRLYLFDRSGECE
jgi:hypothetical protein